MFSKKIKKRFFLMIFVVLICFICATLSLQSKKMNEEKNMNQEERIMKTLGIESEREKLTKKQTALLEQKKQEQKIKERKNILYKTGTASLIAVPSVFILAYVFSANKERKKKKIKEKDLLYKNTDKFKEVINKPCEKTKFFDKLGNSIDIEDLL